MVKNKNNPAEYRTTVEKELNSARIPGFNFNLYLQDTEILQNSGTKQLLYYLLDERDSAYIAHLCPRHECICLVLDTIAFKLLKPRTVWLKEPYSANYFVFYQFEENTFQQLYKTLKSDSIEAYREDVCVKFNRFTLFKLCPDWANYRLTALPALTGTEIDKILELDRKISENGNCYFSINTQNGEYRMPTAVTGMLAKNILPINTLILLEHILLTMSTSSAILDNSEPEQPYIVDFKQFLKSLQFTGKKQKKETILRKNLEILLNTGFIDWYNLDNEKFYFKSRTITKHIRQQIKRKTGFYSLIPATKQAPFVATFLNYLSWICAIPARYEKLTISLETLLCNHLRLDRLLKEHRLSEIAKILNTLRQCGEQYGLIVPCENAQEITSADVKYLFTNKTSLHKYFKLACKAGKELKNG